MKEFFPVSDPAMTQWTDREIVTHILSTITGEGANNVGIFASEVRNVLALVKLVNRFCPDVQIFLINNDLLFTYETFARIFTARSSHPPTRSTLEPRSGAFHPRARGCVRLFSNETDLGRCNACLVLLNAELDPANEGRLLLRGQAEDMLVYGPPFSDVTNPHDAKKRLSSSRLCVWINLVGDDDSWPIRALDAQELCRQGFDQHDKLLNKHKNTLKAKLGSGGQATWTLPGAAFRHCASLLSLAAEAALKDLDANPNSLSGSTNDDVQTKETASIVARARTRRRG